MKWTTETPTEPGWYWMKTWAVMGVRKLELMDGELCMASRAWMPIRPTIDTVWWAGPIPLPEDE